jgi:hypothetical protein
MLSTIKAESGNDGMDDFMKGAGENTKEVGHERKDDKTSCNTNASSFIQPASSSKHRVPVAKLITMISTASSRPNPKSNNCLGHSPDAEIPAPTIARYTTTGLA